MSVEKDLQMTQHIAELEKSIYQIQAAIDARKAEQGSLQNQMRDATSSEKKEWLNERITNLQKIITHFEEGLINRQNNLTEIETMFSLHNPDFVSRKNTLTEVEKSIVQHKQELIDKQNTLLRIKQHR